MRRNLLLETAARVAALLAVAALTVAAAQAAAGPLTVQVAHDDAYGDYLTDGSGMALYVAAAPGKAAEANASGQVQLAACTGACLQVWPPALTAGPPVAGEGVHSELLKTVDGPDGGLQVSYAGWPLYTFAADTSKGDTFGQAVVPPQGAALGAAWYLIAPDGKLILSQPPKQ